MNRAGLPALVRGVRAYFAAYGVTANVVLGWNARNSQINQGPGGANRVCFIPGEFDGSTGAPKVAKAGTMDRNAAQNFVSHNPRMRALAWWHEPITVSCWAVDPSQPQDEESQIEATNALQEATVAAIHNATDPVTGFAVGFANIEEWGAVGWTLPPGENAFGRELTFGLTLLSPLFDAPIQLVTPAASVVRNPAA